MVVISVALSVSIRVDSEHNLQAKYSFGLLPISSSNLAPGASGVPRLDWTKSPLRCAASMLRVSCAPWLSPSFPSEMITKVSFFFLKKLSLYWFDIEMSSFSLALLPWVVLFYLELGKSRECACDPEHIHNWLLFNVCDDSTEQEGPAWRAPWDLLRSLCETRRDRALDTGWSAPRGRVFPLCSLLSPQLLEQGLARAGGSANTCWMNEGRKGLFFSSLPT